MCSVSSLDIESHRWYCIGVSNSFPILYSLTSLGQTQTWQVETSGHRYRTTEGLLGGILTTSAWTECSAKNIGRANATSATEQATKEAAARHKKKIESGYHETEGAISDSRFFEPMLAKSCDDYRADMPWPAFSSPKLDGLRAIGRSDGLFSRNGKPIVSVPHVRAALAPLFAANPDLIFDGEVYAGKLSHDFNRIISLAKKTKPTADDLAESVEVLEYHVFDVIDRSRPELTFAERLAILRSLDLKSPIVLVQQMVIDNDAGLDTLYQMYLDAGYEGQMIRANTPYENKRTKSLLKRKPMESAEFLLIDLLPGRGGAAHRAAKAVLKTGAGDEFEAGIIGDHVYASAIFKIKDRYIGKMATVVYQNMTPGAHPVPRFGKLKELNRTDV